MGCFGSKDESASNQASFKFRRIADKYESYAEVQTALRQSGLESSNLVLAIDFTKSNQWTGARTFGGKCLHAIDPQGFVLNPYQSVISIVGKTLEVFDDDRVIPCFGFGDSVTADRAVFPFFPDRHCHGFEEVLARYNELAPQINLAGPTNFAPAIYESIRIVQETRGYHILVIIADGQVTNEAQTKQAIVEASNYPISIVMVGVGDGPWDMMEEFDDSLPQRRFDNFQFVEFHKVMTYNQRSPEVGFAIAALMEIPDQYRLIRKLGLLN